jgi:hypothetical protein
MGRLCYPTQHPVRVLVPRASGAEKLSRCKAHLRQGFGVRRRVWRTFCRLLASVALAKEAGYKFYGALRVSRYKFDRSSEFIPGYKVGGGHWCDRGINHYEFVLVAGAKAKSVTNNLPILSVLWAVVILLLLDMFLLKVLIDK